MTRLEAINYLTSTGLTEEQVMAIKSLEQQPCNDAISRQAVLDIVDSYSESRSNVEDVTQDIISGILALSPVNPQSKTGWIPVSEGLPSDGKYLVTRGDVIGRPMIGIRYFNKDLSKVDDFDFVDKKGISRWCEYDSEYGWYIDDKVIAWMPLPEPYESQESEG